MTLAVSQYQQVFESFSVASPIQALNACPLVADALTLVSEGP
jgi:hypothetical protein